MAGAGATFSNGVMSSGVNARLAVSVLGILGALASSLARGAAQSSAPRVPLVEGLTIVSALHTEKGDRENAATVVAADGRGATYSWHFRQPAELASRDMPEEGELRRLVRAADLAHAPRLDAIFEGRANGPG